MKKFLYRIGYLRTPIYTNEHDAVFRRTSKSLTQLGLARSIFDDRDLIEDYNESRMRDLKVLFAAALVLALLAMALYLEWGKNTDAVTSGSAKTFTNEYRQ
jgi:ferric-dicitrate binding protein FerR (iron transport regulator)